MSDEVMQDNMQHTMQDNKNPWNADLTDPMLRLRLASERLSIVRYVFLVQVEDGIASADERASLEYADAVLIGWPETDASDVITPDAAQLDDIDEQMRVMEQHIAKFSAMERDHDIVGMTDTLIRVTERVAGIRSIYQPDFPLPTFAEIRRVVQDEWDEDMDKIDPDNASPTADSIEQETADADKEQQAEKQAEQQADGAQRAERPHDRTKTHAAGICGGRFRTDRQLRGRAGTTHVGTIRRPAAISRDHRTQVRTRQLAQPVAHRHHGRHFRSDP